MAEEAEEEHRSAVNWLCLTEASKNKEKSVRMACLMDWLNARIITSTDPFRMKTTENFAAFGSKHRKFFEVIFSDVLIRNGFEVVA